MGKNPFFWMVCQKMLKIHLEAFFIKYKKLSRNQENQKLKFSKLSDLLWNIPYTIYLQLATRTKKIEFLSNHTFVFISHFFDGAKVKFFRFISKQIPYFFFLNSLVLESVKTCCKLLVYLSMKIKNSDHRGTLCIHFRFFRGCQS